MIKNSRFVVEVPNLEIDDLDGYHERLVAAKAEVLKAPVAEPWGMREFLVRTVDGHRIMFGQDLANS
jgi:Glyoxalase/Bleomycin resistance protein/Dioxygenase superfamily